MSSDESSATVKLVSREGESFHVPLEVAKMSQLVADTFEEDDSDDDSDSDSDDHNISSSAKTIQLPKVSSEILKTIVEYGTHYCQVEAMTPIESPLKSARLEDLIQPWYVDFVNALDEPTLFDLVSASNFMDIKPLLDLTCLAVSIVIKSKSSSELREMFDVKEEGTPQLEQEATTS